MNGKINFVSKKAMVFAAMLTAVSGMAGNLIKNSSFEEQSAKTKFPAFWMKSGAYKGEVTVLSGASEAHSGNIAVKIRRTKGDAAIYSQSDLKLDKNRKITATVWAKGNGNFIVYYYLYSRTSFLSSVRTKAAAVNSDQWKKYEFTCGIPAEFGTSKEKVRSVKLAFHVNKGTVTFDDVEIKVVSEAQKK